MTEQVKQEEKDFFDRFDRTGGYERFGEVSYSSVLSLIRKNVDPRPGEVIVDVGCGTGALTTHLLSAFPGTKVIGVDISSGCVSRAAKMYPNLEFRVADAEKTGFPDNSIDVICFFGLLHHFPDFEKVAIEARRVLKPGGRFFSFDPHHYNPALWLYRAHESPFYSPVGVTPNERLMTKREIKTIFDRNGFQSTAKVFSGIRVTYIESKSARRWLGVYNFLDGLLALTPLAGIIGAWVAGWGRKIE